MHLHENPYAEFIGLYNRREYELTVRQEPKQARMCGVGGKGSFFTSSLLIKYLNLHLFSADRRPIDPPPIVQLRVIDPLQRSNPTSNLTGRQIPRPSSPTALSPTTTIASSPAPTLSTATTRDASSASDASTANPQHANEDAGFFVFPDLSVRTEGSYRLKLSLYEVVGYVS
ncbi:velvet factor [Lentinula detonsa]|uniref:Velvet factor n=1 Tax=Lentinula detonsa TaxID=2804962 RepID=A0A9W8NQ53_9AGAR|nr:velvet factor [Lentinula detonsa]